MTIQEGSITLSFLSSSSCVCSLFLFAVQFISDRLDNDFSDLDLRPGPPFCSITGFNAFRVSLISARTANSVGKFFPISQSRCPICTIGIPSGSGSTGAHTDILKTSAPNTIKRSCGDKTSRTCC